MNTMFRSVVCFFSVVAIQVFCFPNLSFAGRNSTLVQEGYVVTNKALLRSLSTVSGITVDHVGPLGFEVYGPRGLGTWLQRNQIPFRNLAGVSKQVMASYPTPEEVAQELIGIAKAYPQLVQLTSIGKSVQGRDLLVMKISKNPTVNDGRPEFKYIANMHGDEIVGRELMMLLIKDLLGNYGKDAFITRLVDSTQIYIMPSMNPDGAAVARRGNANSVDLNRDFPDFSTSDNKNTPDGRAPETQAVMRWQAAHKFALSVNFHGGAECVSYLWDTTPQRHPKDQFISAMALKYAQLTPYIGASTVFKNGITNGYDWYEVNGGMQDWSTYYHSDMHFTIELSNTKWPNPSTISYYYQQNRNALVQMISWIGQVPAFSRLRP